MIIRPRGDSHELPASYLDRTLYELRMVLKESLSTIAAKMGRAKSTLSRELRRNQINGVKHLVAEVIKREETRHLPDTAEMMAAKRREAAKSPFDAVSAPCLEEIKARLARYHSPEQIAGRLKREVKEWVSHETIYRMIYAEYEGLGEYKKYLRHSRERRCQAWAWLLRPWADSQSSRHRSASSGGRREKASRSLRDTMVGKGHRGAVVIYVDKAFKFLLAALCPDRTARSVNEATVSLFEELPGTPLSFTFDNGKEFSKHQELSEKLKAPCFFANAYASWERGLNEHSNGLIRQFFPKKPTLPRFNRSSLSMPLN